MSIRGVFASNQGIVGERVGDLSSRVLMNGYGGTAPLLALSSGMPSKNLKDSSWSWTEDQHVSGNTTCPAGATNVATSVAVADANIWTSNSIVMVESTGEYMLITAIAGNTLTVVRGLAGTTPTAIAAAARIQLIGTAFAEGSGKPDAVAQNGEQYTNLVQIFKNGWAVTGTAKAIDYITGDRLARNKQMAIGYHAEDIERTFLFGKRTQQVIGGKELRTTNGIISMLQQYGGLVQSAAYATVAGNMSIAGLQSFVRQIFDRRVKGMANERIAFTSSEVLERIQQMARLDSTYDMTVKDTEYGFNITTLNFLGNKLNMMTHPLMIENALWSKQLYVLHPGLIEKRILRGTWMEEFNAQRSNNAGIDAEEGFVGDEMGFHLSGARCQGMMTNILAGVAS